MTAHRVAGERVLIELEPGIVDAPWGKGSALSWIDAAVTSFERTADLPMLFDRAATTFQMLTGFDRVMLYRFLDEDAGRVVAEARSANLPSFLHHHFPASDIPKQARALYVRNKTRSIPDVDYVPAPIRPEGFETLDLSDVSLRSVSPVHVRYLKNMGVAASASISIVKDGLLWGMIACHHYTPAACRPNCVPPPPGWRVRWHGRSGRRKRPISTASACACARRKTTCCRGSSAWATWSPPSAA
ncbi:GAF domain-containing protein [Sphingomonas sp. I4]